MKISKLFGRIDHALVDDDFKGEFTLYIDKIIWSFDSDKHEFDCDETETYEDDLLKFQFCNEEKLNEIYTEVLDIMEMFLDSINELSNVKISDATVNNNVISFNITE